MPKCSGNINCYCYICGEFVVPERRLPLSGKVEHNNAFYFSKVIMQRDWTPNISCKYCYNALHDWSIGKRQSMLFGVPMQWSNPGRKHNPNNCYMCVNDARSRNRNQLKYFRYQSVESAILPQPHSDAVPVPKRPSPQTENMDSPFEQPDAPSVAPVTVNPSLFVAEEVPKPILLTEQHLHSIARHLSLGKLKSEMLAVELQSYNLLAPGASVTSFRDRNTRFREFFTINNENTFVYCHDVNGLMEAMNILDYKAEEWRLFIDSSQSSLKGISIQFCIDNI